VRPAHFVGTARADLVAFPEAARRRAGYQLFMVQVGREPADFKPLPGVGPGAFEIRVREDAGAFRVIYVAKFEDIELAATRYKSIGAKA
jgi:phage-related protein